MNLILSAITFSIISMPYSDPVLLYFVSTTFVSSASEAIKNHDSNQSSLISRVFMLCYVG
ncbi:hypothetical protein T05_15750 [Trichinella murrelli]|uniref:Uncharacterized protein n=1 Tax=Trichinella murrelli TaxID=144512 RepID=A0A0V0UG42_9BILA|nr:hypothetical protein T05_15750 [Trichinella murrelli]